MRKERESLQVKLYAEEDFQSFYVLYAKVFAEPPWCENWTETEVKKEIQGYSGKKNLNFLLATLPLANRGNALVGFSVAYEAEPELFPDRVAELLKPYSLPIVYGDELAVACDFRNQGIGSMLMEYRLKSFNALYKNGVIFVGRTDIDSKMVPLYKKLGFENSAINDPEFRRRYYFINIRR